ncbi:MAG TPA: methyltransferase [Gammaproteobacteria bacterium]
MQARKIVWGTLAGLALGGAVALAQAQDSQEARMRAALASPERSAENKARDAARKPIEVVQFLGIEDGMTVLDVIAAGGWFTEVLSAAVGPEGKVYSQNPPFFVQREGFAEAEEQLVERLGNVEPLHGDLPQDSIAGEIDVAVSALNLHDLYNSGGEQAGLRLLEGVYAALKPGGVFGLIDHVGEDGRDNRTMHRIPKDVARDLLEKAGFTIEAESDLLANPADDHTKGVRDPSLQRRTDQFLFKARKPG